MKIFPRSTWLCYHVKAAEAIWHVFLWWYSKARPRSALIFRILRRSGHTDGAPDPAQQHDQPRSLCSPRTVLAAHRCPFVVVGAPISSITTLHSTSTRAPMVTGGTPLTLESSLCLCLFLCFFWYLWKTEVIVSGHYNLRAVCFIT